MIVQQFTSKRGMGLGCCWGGVFGGFFVAVVVGGFFFGGAGVGGYFHLFSFIFSYFISLLLFIYLLFYRKDGVFFRFVCVCVCE